MVIISPPPPNQAHSSALTKEIHVHTDHVTYVTDGKLKGSPVTSEPEGPLEKHCVVVHHT